MEVVLQLMNDGSYRQVKGTEYEASANPPSAQEIYAQQLISLAATSADPNSPDYVKVTDGAELKPALLPSTTNPALYP